MSRTQKRDGLRTRLQAKQALHTLPASAAHKSTSTVETELLPTAGASLAGTQQPPAPAAAQAPASAQQASPGCPPLLTAAQTKGAICCLHKQGDLSTLQRCRSVSQRRNIVVSLSSQCYLFAINSVPSCCGVDMNVALCPYADHVLATAPVNARQPHHLPCDCSRCDTRPFCPVPKLLQRARPRHCLWRPLPTLGMV